MRQRIDYVGGPASAGYLTNRGHRGMYPLPPHACVPSAVVARFSLGLAARERAAVGHLERERERREREGEKRREEKRERERERERENSEEKGRVGERHRERETRARETSAVAAPVSRAASE